MITEEMNLDRWGVPMEPKRESKKPVVESKSVVERKAAYEADRYLSLVESRIDNLLFENTSPYEINFDMKSERSGEIYFDGVISGDLSEIEIDEEDKTLFLEKKIREKIFQELSDLDIKSVSVQIVGLPEDLSDVDIEFQVSVEFNAPEKLERRLVDEFPDIFEKVLKSL